MTFTITTKNGYIVIGYKDTRLPWSSKTTTLLHVVNKETNNNDIEDIEVIENQTNKGE